IGSLVLENQLILAPMFKVTDPAFRLLCRDHGAALAYCEMTNAEAILRNPRVVAQAIRHHPRETPFGIQLAAKSPESLAKAISILEPHTDTFDLNLGCPAKRTINSGVGSALLTTPDQIIVLVSAMRNATTKPITVKIRLPDDKRLSLGVAKAIEAAGADALTVHARTVTQGRSGPVDTDIVAQIKDALAIPVINNGGVYDAQSFKDILSKTGCDGVMLARSAIGNPGIFAELSGGGPMDRVVALRQYLAYCHETGFLHAGRIKTNALHFLEHAPAEVKRMVQKIRTITELETTIRDLPEGI
ncbi:MAG: tRNA-dihydrouridine synthase family protein, partial [Candidatus Diapherotrites archaeon]|nr:tRNA-dihydrouridine synthase family protein [Candidatus Diapherotrites archaeon]